MVVLATSHVSSSSISGGVDDDEGDVSNGDVNMDISCGEEDSSSSSTTPIDPFLQLKTFLQERLEGPASRGATAATATAAASSEASMPMSPLASPYPPPPPSTTTTTTTTMALSPSSVTVSAYEVALAAFTAPDVTTSMMYDTPSFQLTAAAATTTSASQAMAATTPPPPSQQIRTATGAVSHKKKPSASPSPSSFSGGEGLSGVGGDGGSGGGGASKKKKKSPQSAASSVSATSSTARIVPVSRAPFVFITPVQQPVPTTPFQQLSAESSIASFPRAVPLLRTELRPALGNARTQ